VFGGRGSVLRTLLGVIFVSVLDNVLILLGFTFGFQQLALGALILVAVTLDVLSRKLGQK
jgi:ribose transport system permease protein